MAAGLGLSPADMGLEGLAAERWSAGNPFTFVPVRGLDAMKRCRIDIAKFDEAFGSGAHPAAFVFCRETAEAGHSFHARMFAPVIRVMRREAERLMARPFRGSWPSSRPTSCAGTWTRAP